MSKKILYILLACCFTASCQNSQFTNEFNKNIEFFPDKLVLHFPSQIEDSCFYISSNFLDSAKLESNDGLLVHEFMLIKQFDKASFKQEMSEIAKNTSTILSCNDTNQFLVGRTWQNAEYNIFTIEGYEDGDESKKIIARNIKNVDGLAIPIFPIREFYKNTATRLSDDFMIYLIDCKSGRFLKRGNNKLRNEYKWPAKWRNGYSRGYAVSSSKNVIIYWIIAW